MSASTQVVLGLDFGTESVRALLVDLTGNERASAVVPFQHGQITEHLPGKDHRLPPAYALQHPMDWIESAAKATIAARRKAKLDASEIVGIGVDFTSCTMFADDARWHATVHDRQLRRRTARLAEALEASRRAGSDRSHQRSRARAGRIFSESLRRNHRA